MTIAKKHKAKFGANTQLITLSAVFAALTYAMTAFIHIPTAKGYIHIGDAVVFMAASLLPTPYAMASAAVGAALSDALSGYWIWVPATLVIKALTAAAFTSKKQKIICRRNILALWAALLLCVVGYGLYGGAVIYGSLKAGFIDAPGNILQTGASALVYISLGAAMDRSGIKHKI